MGEARTFLFVASGTEDGRTQQRDAEGSTRKRIRYCTLAPSMEQQTPVAPFSNNFSCWLALDQVLWILTRSQRAHHASPEHHGRQGVSPAAFLLPVYARAYLDLGSPRSYPAPLWKPFWPFMLGSVITWYGMRTIANKMMECASLPVSRPACRPRPDRVAAPAWVYQ